MFKAIFVTVRTNSTRLPNKCLLEIHGRKTIQILLDRIRWSKLADQIIVCTTTNPEDDILCEIANEYDDHIYWYQGSEQDKLVRWKGAAEQFGVDFFVTADGDDLLCGVDLIDLALEQADQGADFIEAPGLICGAFTYGIRTKALNKVCEIKDTDDTEMMWTYFKDTGLFNVQTLQGIPKEYYRPEIRLTLDYPEDFLLFKVLAHDLGPQPTMMQIIEHLDKNPKILAINSFRQQEFLENQRNKTKLAIKGNHV